MSSGDKKARLYYHRLPEFWRKENKLDFLSDNSLSGVDWQRLVPLDLHGHVRLNPKISGTTHNVFGIQVGVGVTLAIRARKDT